MSDTRPENCRFRMHDEGKAYPRSSCPACGKTVLTGLGNRCDFVPAPAVPDDVAAAEPTEGDIWQMRAEEAEEVVGSLRATIEAQAAELARLRDALTELCEACSGLDIKRGDAALAAGRAALVARGSKEGRDG